MKQAIFSIFFVFSTLSVFSQIPETYLNNKSLSYSEVIKYYQQLADKYPQAKLIEYGKTDVGKPLDLFVISPDKIFNPAEIHLKGKAIILVNNGIHPGEPEGIDASLHLSAQLLKNPKELKKKLKNVVLCIIPVYNIGGALTRSAYNRANQQTPNPHGFRGNARHLDLNRDFVKNATQNSRSFVQIFQEWKPQLFLDTHTTDGSDHQYVMTLIATQHNMLPYFLGSYLNKKLVPYLFHYMDNTAYPMTPYVYPVKNENPEFGIKAFPDTPMFSTGYAALFNTLGFITENHIFKEFKDRVKSVILFEQALINFANNNSKELIENQQKANAYVAQQKKFALQYQLDTLNVDTFNFRGYKAEIKKSPLTGLPRLEYSHNKPYTHKIPVYNNYVATKFIQAPKAYIIPQAYPEIIQKMKANGVKMKQLKKDSLMNLQVIFINNYQTSKRAYNAHYVHGNVQIHREKQKIQCYAGDYIIPVNQPTNRYIVEMLEPQGMDSFFKWNFFDEFLERREYFSSIGFEANALKYLKNHPKLATQFHEAVAQDTVLQKNHYKQLQYIYNHSEYTEKSYKRLPVYSITND